LPLKKAEEVEAPTDPELKAIEDAALDFMSEQKDVDTEPEVGDDSRGEDLDINLRPIERGTAEYEAILDNLDADGAIAPAAPRKLAAKALAINAGIQVEAPQGKGLQPEAVENPIINAPVPAAGYTGAADLLRALTDSEYRKSLPRE
jgi:hypothetical protein